MDTSTPPPQAPMADPSPSTKQWLTIVALVFSYPLGLIIMWGWMKHWPRGLKVLLTFPLLGVPFIMFAITLIAVNPGRQFQSTNNTKRSADVNGVGNAIWQYAADSHNTFPPGIGQTPQSLSSPTFKTLCTELVPTYIAALPRDPLIKDGLPIQAADCAGDWDTGYTVRRSASGKSIIIAAPKAELNQVIETTR